MSTRTDALIKELAALLVKYRPADWEPIITELERGDRGRLARMVAELAATPAKTRTKVNRATKAKGTRTKAGPQSFPLLPEREATLAPVVNALTTKRILPTIGDVRAAFSALGLKGSPPGRRAEMVNAIIAHLNSIEETRLPAAIEVVAKEAAKSGRDNSYQRWFDLIEADASAKIASPKPA